MVRDETRVNVLVFGRTRDDADKKSRVIDVANGECVSVKGAEGDNWECEFVRNCDQKLWSYVFYLSE